MQKKKCEAGPPGSIPAIDQSYFSSEVIWSITRDKTWHLASGRIAIIKKCTKIQGARALNEGLGAVAQKQLQACMQL